MKKSSAAFSKQRIFYLQIMAILFFAGICIFYLESRFENELHSFRQRDERKATNSKTNAHSRNGENAVLGKIESQLDQMNAMMSQLEEDNERVKSDLAAAQFNDYKNNLPNPNTNKREEYSRQLIEEKKKKKVEKLANLTVSTYDCVHTIHRDYTKTPVEFSGLEGSSIACDVPCARGSRDLSSGLSKSCPHVKRWERTMENTGNSHGDYQRVAGNTRHTSDVIIQYYSWAEYDFMQPPQPKTATAMLAVLISNCGPKYRLEYLQELMDNGVTVHSYGGCMNNMDGAKSDANRLNNKIKSIIPKYKFTFAFENSETDDYVTEKFFGPLVAGSIPIYYGAPNAKKFAPNNHSVIFAADFKGPAELAAYLKELDQSDDKYNQYLTWKTEGPSKDFIASMDLSLVHSSCRFCIRSADIDRKTIGEVVTGPFQQENEQEMKTWEGIAALMLKVRERGTFWMRAIHIETLRVEEAHDKILLRYNDSKKGDIHSFYRLWDRTRTPITTDQQVKELEYGDELEIIFENPGDPRRGSYSSWWNTNQQSQVSQ